VRLDLSFARPSAGTTVSDPVWAANSTMKSKERRKESRNFQKRGHTFRRMQDGFLLTRFPYGLIYLVEDETIVVVAVMHSSRDPIVWQRRLEEMKTHLRSSKTP